MLEFNTRGLLIPSSIIKSSINEFESQFAIGGSGDIRKGLYNQYIRYNHDLKEACGGIKLTQWIDGSFVTKNPKPGDIDLVTFIDFTVVQTNETALKQFIYPASMANYQVDGYIVVIYPEDHKLHFTYQSDRSYWIDRFDKTKPSKRHKRFPKGFLEIIA